MLGVGECNRRLPPERVDIKPRSGGEGEYSLPELRGARALVGAADIDVAFLRRGERRAAGGARRGHDELTFISGSVCLNRAEDLGEDIAGIADDHGLPDEHTLAADRIGVVPAGHFYG